MSELPAYRVLRSRRRTLSLEITPAGEALVRAPLRTGDELIRAFVAARAGWLETHMAAFAARKAAEAAIPRLSPAELEALRREAREKLEARARHFAPLLGVDWERITVRTQRTRWGSCSARGNLSFNALLALAPPEILDYVVVHELCHRIEMNHSDRFWQEVGRVFPDYRNARKWLRTEGKKLIAGLDD